LRLKPILPQPGSRSVGGPALTPSASRFAPSRRPASKTAALGRLAAEPCGFSHLDLKQDLTRLHGERAYAYVAIDRATRFVPLETHPRRDAATARFLRRFAQFLPAQIPVVLTDNGSEFTDRCTGPRSTEASTMRARSTWFCRRLRSATIASNRSRFAARTITHRL
jgi:Integrase core domain